MEITPAAQTHTLIQDTAVWGSLPAPHRHPLWPGLPQCSPLPAPARSRVPSTAPASMWGQHPGGGPFRAPDKPLPRAILTSSPPPSMPRAGIASLLTPGGLSLVLPSFLPPLRTQPQKEDFLKVFFYIFQAHDTSNRV